MAEVASDPFLVVSREAPKFTVDELRGYLQEYYCLNASFRSLVSERDQNFHLQCDDGRQFVLKIANAVEDPVVTDFQNQALLHLEAVSVEHDGLPSTPRILRTTTGETHFIASTDAQSHIARVVSFVEGVPLADESLSLARCSEMGVCLAQLGQALRGFDHPGSSPSLLWDMQHALQLRKILQHIPDPGLRMVVNDCLNDFERFALPRFADLRYQVIHSDFHPDNVLVDPGEAGKVVGVIDFGDMLRAPLIVDVAVAAAYMRTMIDNPLHLIAAFVNAYHAVTPLTDAEIDILFDLIKTRLAATISILYWRASLRGADDPYLASVSATESSAQDFLLLLMKTSRREAYQYLKQACESD